MGVGRGVEVEATGVDVCVGGGVENVTVILGAGGSNKSQIT